MNESSIRALAIATCSLCLAACGSTTPSPTTGARVVHVVAVENFWGNIVEQIGGRHAAVSSIISDPTADPHLYSSDARDAARLAEANLVVLNGLGYDDFARKLLAASPNSKRRALTVADVLRPVGHDPNPHLWYDVDRIPEVAQAIAGALLSEDPRDGRYFQTRAKRFIASLRPLLATLEAIRARHSGAPVGYTERVPGYLLQNAGLTVKSPPGFARAIESGSEPSPADVQRMTSVLTHRQVAVLLYNAQASTPTTTRIRALAAASGVPVVPVTETLPPGEPTYQSWQLQQARALLRALGG